jgi:LPS-assembly lipoprotein
VGTSKNALFPQWLRQLRARILMYALYTAVLRAVQIVLFLEVPMYRSVFTLLLLLSASACGFQLRGAVELPAVLQPVYLYGAGEEELAHQLAVLLKENNTVLADAEAQAASRLKIVSQKQTRRILSVDSRGRAREYELNYSVLYQLSSEHINADNVVKLRRVLAFDPDNVLGASNEEQTLYRDMQRDAARLILQQLEAMTKKNSRPDATTP